MAENRLEELINPSAQVQELSLDDAGPLFSQLVDYVKRHNERVILQDCGKNVVAIIPMDDFEVIRKLDDMADAASADQALEDMKRTHKKPIPWTTIKNRLGLT